VQWLIAQILFMLESFLNFILLDYILSVILIQIDYSLS